LLVRSNGDGGSAISYDDILGVVPCFPKQKEQDIIKKNSDNGIPF
jgi:hypothetical protein